MSFQVTTNERAELIMAKVYFHYGPGPHSSARIVEAIEAVAGADRRTIKKYLGHLRSHDFVEREPEGGWLIVPPFTEKEVEEDGTEE